MSIVNQSITPNGQPLFPSKGSNSQDASQHLPMPLPLQGVHSLKPFQPGSSNRALSAIATEGSINGICNFSEFDPFSLSFSHSLTKDEKLHNTPCEPVLSVAVSSAVKLDSTQIDLISRKMQRLTGFRNIRVDNIIDPSLIAGFVIDDGSNIIDLSVKGQLAALAARVESSDQRMASHGQSWSFTSNT